MAYLSTHQSTQQQHESDGHEHRTDPKEGNPRRELKTECSGMVFALAASENEMVQSIDNV